MDDLRTWIENLWAIEMVRSGVKALCIVLVGLLATRVVNRRLKLWSLHAQHRLIVRRLTAGLIIVLTAAWAMSVLGVEFGVVLGTAGVLTVAVGFAAQTSFSNLISGIFLMAEQPFRVGDVISVGETSGEVLSIDLLSVKLCTFDNLQVRIPNETMLKANVVNQTRFPIRRYDFKLGLNYDADLTRVRDILLGIAEDNLLCLRNPRPMFAFLGFGQSAIEIQLSVWAKRQSLFEMRTEMAIAIKRAFEEHGIEMPVAQRQIQLGPGASTYIDRASDDGAVPEAAPDTAEPAGRA
jgi:small-conductance mechanosensitive channel